MARALLVGIDTYYGFGKLKGPSQDIGELESWLVSQGVTNIKKIVSVPDLSVFRAVPVVHNIEDWLDSLDDEFEVAVQAAKQNSVPVAKFPLDDRIYVYYGGHGYDARTAGPTGIFPRTRAERWDVLPIEPLVRHLQHSAYFKEIVVIFDACREVVSYSIDPMWTRTIDPKDGSDEVIVTKIYASTSTQTTKEIDFGSGRIRGVVTQAFLSAVKGLAAKSNKVTAQNMKDHVINAVKTKLPTAKPEIVLTDEKFVLASGVATLQPILEIDCPVSSAGEATIRAHASGVSLKIELKEGKNKFQVPLGAYTLTDFTKKETVIDAVWEVNSVQV